MRTFAFAVLLFTVGFGVIFISQNASATIGHNQIILKLRDKVIAANPPAESQQGKTFADYLAAADRAFDDLDRSCSDAARARLGAAFGGLVEATRNVHAGTIEPGPMSAATAAAGSSQAMDHLRIYSQVIDASRRGVLQGRHFPAGAARLMFVQMKTAGDGVDVQHPANVDQPDDTGFETVRCAPL